MVVTSSVTIMLERLSICQEKNYSFISSHAITGNLGIYCLEQTSLRLGCAAGDTAEMLTLELHGEEITGAAYLRAARAFLHVIEQVADEMSRRIGAVETIVTVSAGSNLLHVDTIRRIDEAPNIELIENAVFVGLSQLEKIEGRPANFNNRALSSVRSLAGILRGQEFPVDRVTVIAGQQRMEVTGRSEVAVGELLKSDYHDYGTVEGRLQTITERKRTRIYVFDDLTDRKVSCRIDTGVRQQALEYFGKRVEARGLIRYRIDGEPISIQIEELALIDADDLPSADDVYGILGGAH